MSSNKILQNLTLFSNDDFSQNVVNICSLIGGLFKFSLLFLFLSFLLNDEEHEFLFDLLLDDLLMDDLL